MRTNLKSVKETPKTFTMTFEVNDKSEMKKLKALSILLGNYNQMRNEMQSQEKVLEVYNKFREELYLDELVSNIAKLLK